MEISTSSSDTVYVYTGRRKVVLDDHHPEYEMDFTAGDEFTVRHQRGKVVIIHQDEPKLKFTADTSDRKYKLLMKNSETRDFVFIPNAKKPVYPVVVNMDFDTIPKLYDYFNKEHFNGLCPKKVHFVKSNSSKGSAPFGVAISQRYKGKPFYRMKVNASKIGEDAVLLTDVLLHEMIHLMLMRKGIEEFSKEHLYAAHGPLFQDEARRLNAKGFNISTFLDWEKRDSEVDTDIDINLIVIVDEQHPNYCRYFWSLKDLSNDFEHIMAQAQELSPLSKLTGTLYVTKDSKFRAFSMLNSRSRINKREFDKKYRSMAVDGRFIHRISTAVLNAEISKKEEPFYAQPLHAFEAWAKREKGITDKDSARQAWSTLKISAILKYAKEDLNEILKLQKRGANDSEIKRRLNLLHARFDGRVSVHEYRSQVRGLLDSMKIEDPMFFSHLGV